MTLQGFTVPRYELHGFTVPRYELHGMNPDFRCYHDSDCTSEITGDSPIHWGTLMPGQTATIDIWVKNFTVGDGRLYSEAVTLLIHPQNFVPTIAEPFFVFSRGMIWAKDQVRMVTLRLYVKPEVSGFTEFSFDILLTGLSALALDLWGPNGMPDGKINMGDIAVVAVTFGRNALDGELPSWDSIKKCDVWEDQMINMKDIAFIARSFGESLVPNPFP